MTTPLTHLRWAIRAVLTLGVAASVAANILHAQNNPISQTIAAWPPLALLLTVELISRVPVHRRGLAAARLIATVLIAGIAAWVSYWHMVGVAERYGETGASPYLLPLSVDGLVVVASVCLVEISGRLAADVSGPVEDVSGPVEDVSGPVEDVSGPVEDVSGPGRYRRGELQARVAAALAHDPDVSVHDLARSTGSSPQYIGRVLRRLTADRELIDA